MWLVRYNEQLGKLKRGGLDIVTSLPDVAGWQALNLAGLTEDRIERVVSGLPDAERACLFNSRDSSPGRAWSSNERERERVQRNARPHHRWGQSRPTSAAERTQNHSASSAQWDTCEEVVDTEDEDNDGSDTIDPGHLLEYVPDNSRCWPPAWTMVKMMLRFQVWTIHSWKQDA